MTIATTIFAKRGAYIEDTYSRRFHFLKLHNSYIDELDHLLFGGFLHEESGRKNEVCKCIAHEE